MSDPNSAEQWRGDDQKESARPAVMFVCVSNRGKSVMAEALMAHRAGDRVKVSSAGIEAKSDGQVNELSAQVLAEVGAGVSDHQPRRLTDAMMVAADLIVVVGTAHLDPPSGATVEVWETDEPSLRGIDGIERMRLVRDDIATRVSDLADRLLR